MLRTCSYRRHMPRMIQLRHVPDDLHRKLKARAALEGLSLSDYLLREVRRVAERPTWAELRHRLAPYPHDLFLSGIGDLRDILTAYDAAYVAPVEALAPPLVPRDAALASRGAIRARVELM